MFKRGGIVAPRGSFPHPVIPPDVDPASGDTKTVTISCAWLPFIRGALKQLLLESTWTKPGVDLTLVKKRVFTLIDLFTECATVEIPFACGGDIRFEMSPFGTFSLFVYPPTIGAFVPMAGWQTTIAEVGDTTYNGVHLKVHFAAPVQITHINILYDLTKGQVINGSELALYVYDLDNSAYFTPELSFDSLSDGNGQEQDFVYGGGTTQNILIRLFASSRAGAVSPSPAGLGYLIGMIVSGLGNNYDCT